MRDPGSLKIMGNTEHHQWKAAHLRMQDWLMSLCACLIAQLCPTLCNPMDCSLSGSSVHRDSPGKNTRVRCHSLLQGIVPTQEANWGLLNCRQILYQLSYQGSPVNVLCDNNGASQVELVVKDPPANAEDIRDSGLIAGSERSSGGGHGDPLRYSCLENPMGWGAWQATVHRVAKSWTEVT